MDGFFLFSRKVNAKRTPWTLEAELVEPQVLQSSERWILLPCPSRMAWKKGWGDGWNVDGMWDFWRFLASFFCIVFCSSPIWYLSGTHGWDLGCLMGFGGGMLKTKQLSLFRTVCWVNGWINSCQLLQQNWVQGAFKKGFLNKNFQSNLTLQLPK